MVRYLRTCEAQYRVMVTLTYPGQGDEWHRAKEHLAELIKRLRRDDDRAREQAARGGAGAHGELEPWSCFWFVEFQRRGVPHFHLFLTHAVGITRLARSWFEIVGSGDERHLRAGTRVERLRKGRNGTISYARKYARKMEQKQLPPLLQDQGFGRWWGIAGHRATVAAATKILDSDREDWHVTLYAIALEKTLDRLARDGRARHFRFEFADCWVTLDDDAESEASLAFDLLTQAVANWRAVEYATQMHLHPSKGAASSVQ